LGYCYDGSPIVCPDGTPPLDLTARAFRPSARPGTRAPHAWIAQGRSTLDLFGGGYTLLALGPQPQDASAFVAAAQARGLPLRHETIASEDIAQLYAAGLVLVRPDGHVAWRGGRYPADPGRLLDLMRGLLPQPVAASGVIA
jgi:hypothetical protein